MKNILITGGAGFIGVNLSRKLLEQGNKVIAIDNFITSSKKNLINLAKYPKFIFIHHDITKTFPNALISHLSSLDFIYHLACPTGVPNLTKLSEEMLLTCSIGTKNVLDLLAKANAKFLFASSSEVYGDPEVFPQTEEYKGDVDSTGLRSPYEEGKRFSESLVMAYIRKYNIDAKIVRIFNTYGPYSFYKDGRVIPKFLNQIKNGHALTVEGEGLQTRTFCYVDDLVDGLALVLEKGETGGVYNLGSDIETSILDLAKFMINISKSKNHISFIQRPSHDHKRRLPCLEKVKKLGWHPKVSLAEGIKKTILSL